MRIAHIRGGTRIGVLVQVFDDRIDVFDEHSVLEKKNPRRWVVVVEKMSSEKKGPRQAVAAREAAAVNRRGRGRKRRLTSV